MRITEQPGPYRHLEKMELSELLAKINEQDKLVPLAIEAALKQIERLVEAITDKMLAGGRLFYIGAGTSGRLGILDASEIPPTYGMPHDKVIAIIAGGKEAIQKPIENAEDDLLQGWIDLQHHEVSTKDVVIGIASSGTTPYVLAAVKACKLKGITTGCITCNPSTPLALNCDYPIEVIVGPEVVTGSTRMKAGTAQKLVLNMISTSVMIQIGRVIDNNMVNMQLTNAKLIDRGTRMVMEQGGIKEYEHAKQLLMQYGSVKKAVDYIRSLGV